MNYQDFIKAKTRLAKGKGIKIDPTTLNPALYPFQNYIVDEALSRGKCAVFADCGLGKTLMQLSWAEKISGLVLIVAPLAVADQTIEEGRRFGIDVNLCKTQSDVITGINITNYEKLHHFDLSKFNGVVLDESSILKNSAGKVKTSIIEGFRNTPYKLACTATPAPNDFMELGNHAEFLNICKQTEMLAEYFCHDGGETQKWRIKGHAIKPFWRWVGTWAITLNKPSDIGYENAGFDLPKLNIKDLVIKANYQEQGFLFPMPASTLQERRIARKNTISERTKAIAEIINKDATQSHLVWCNLNNEAEEITKLIPGAVEIRGSHSPEEKRDSMLKFTHGEIKVLVTKPSIAGFGMNWQHCSSVFFCGLSDSYEEFYQAIRRCWRYGQTKDVTATVVISDTEGAVVQNIKRKELDSQKMALEMVKLFKEANNG